VINDNTVVGAAGPVTVEETCGARVWVGKYGKEEEVTGEG